MSILIPGKSCIALGPSGTGKSTFARTMLEHHGSGIIVLAPGKDEMESYAPLYPDAAEPKWDDDGGVTIPDAKYVFASFDDPEFAPSLGPKHLKADAQKRMVFFLRAVRSLVQKDIEDGKPPRWGCIVQDTYSGIGDLAYNAMLSSMKIIEPPKARGDGGATFYGGLSMRLQDVARATRVLKGLGMDWFATTHVKVAEASKAMKASEAAAKDQYMPLIVGAFREKLTPMFDLALHTSVNSKGEYVARWDADHARQAKSRYGALHATSGTIANNWKAVLEAIESAERPYA